MAALSYGGPSPLPKKQSALDTEASNHLNPQLLAPFLYEKGQKAFSFRGFPLTPTGGSERRAGGSGHRARYGLPQF